ncbi:hypothetical protein Pmani_001098 [Petrolisthes manimaculis]|uniref:BTB domain-containing protein n=1 Tax=Petrolisthes manimaculis TaxID=1843537 RepID=A0AAE1QLF7_9EUCA|nr:hypothetical protein Pmani_001098 [Petrolisthes manimaculis]
MWKNHHAAFCDILTRLRERGTFTDVTLVCEGKFYPVHKLVLSACSEHLEKILENTQCRHPTIVLHGIKCCDLEQLLMFMYTGEVNVLQRSLSQLMQAAELLEIKGLAIPDNAPAANIVKENTKENSSRESSVSPPSKRRKHKDQNSNHEGTDQAWNSPQPGKMKEKSTSPENNKQKYKDRSSNQGKDGQEVFTSPLTSISSKHPPEGQENVECSPSRYSQQPEVGREKLPERQDSKRPCVGKSETDDVEILVKEEVEEQYCPNSVASPDVICQAGDDGINTSPAFLKDDGSMLVNTWSSYEVGQTLDHSSLQSHHQHHGMILTQNKQWGGEREVGSETHNSRMGDSELLSLASDPPDTLLHNQQVPLPQAVFAASLPTTTSRSGASLLSATTHRKMRIPPPHQLNPLPHHSSVPALASSVSSSSSKLHIMMVGSECRGTSGRKHYSDPVCRLDQSKDHSLIKIAKRLRCRVCARHGKRKDTHWRCKTCLVPLCMAKCHNQYHSVV